MHVPCSATALHSGVQISDEEMRTYRTGFWGAALFGLLLVFLYAAWPQVARRFVFMPRPVHPSEKSPAYWGMGSEAEEVHFTTSDRVRLHAWWFRSRGEQACGTAIYFHGNNGNLLSRIRFAQNLAADGMQVLLVDYRGFGASEGVPSEPGLYRDASAAYHYVRTARGTRPNQIVLVGHSIGAAVAAELAGHHEVAALVLLSPFSSFPGATRARLPWLPDRVVNWDGSRFPTAVHVRRVRAPVLVARGQGDRFTVRSDALRVFDAVPGLKTWVEVPEVGHNDLSTSDGLQSALLRFRAHALNCPTGT